MARLLWVNLDESLYPSSNVIYLQVLDDACFARPQCAFTWNRAFFNAHLKPLTFKLDMRPISLYPGTAFNLRYQL